MNRATIVESPSDPRDISNPQGWMWTSGRRVWPLELRSDDIDVQAAANALSKLCRFGGHINEFYSVAEHCVHVSHVIQRRGHSPVSALCGLLHDLSEGYIIDLPRPIKNAPSMDAYRFAEIRAEYAVAAAYGHLGVTAEGLRAPEVAKADNDMLELERWVLFDTMSDRWQSYGAEEPEGTNLLCLDWRPARALFVQRFEELKALIEWGGVP